MPNEPNTDTDNTYSGQLYEIGYLFVPVIPEDEATDAAEALKDIVKNGNGELVAEGEPEMRELAYTMEKVTESGKKQFDSAWFGWVQFAADSSDIEAIDAAVKSHEDILRHLLIKIDAPTPDVEETEEQEVDDAIDELVIE